MIGSKSFKAFCFLLGLCILVADYSSKLWVQEAFYAHPDRFPIVFLPDFFGIQGQLTYTVNSGAAWGLFAAFPNLLVFFRIAFISGILVYLVRFNTHKSWQIPLVCIVSGAIGNVIDFFSYGFVIDMIQMTFWGYNYPVFNLADSFIFIGAFWILLLTFFEKEQAT